MQMPEQNFPCITKNMENKLQKRIWLPVLNKIFIRDVRRRRKKIGAASQQQLAFVKKRKLRLCADSRAHLLLARVHASISF